MDMRPCKRIAVIGLDGATWDILDPLMDRGYMPNLKRAIEDGARADMHSTRPPMTALAWTTFHMGLKPGSHGIYDFSLYQPGRYQPKLINYLDLPAYTFWERLAQAGRRPVVINAPFTYPPPNIDGVVVSGFLSPGDRSHFTHPPELREELLQQVPDYRIFYNPSVAGTGGIENYARTIKEVLEARRQAALYLMDHQTWDFFLVQFQHVDIFQHSLFPQIREAAQGDAYPAIREVFRVLDDAVGDIRSRLTDDDLLVVFSDHGFGELQGEFDLNLWLTKNGFQKRKYTKALLNLGARLAIKLDVLNLRYRLHPQSGGVKKLARAFNLELDWSQTRAFSINGSHYGHIYINLKGREPEGIVPPEAYESVRQELADRLMDLRSPADGKPVVKHVWRRKELFSGRYLDYAPDLLVQNREGYKFVTNNKISEGRLYFPSRLGHNGNHRPVGMAVFAGKHVNPAGEDLHLDIQDFAPTILGMMGEPIPKGLEGVFRAEFFGGDSPEWVNYEDLPIYREQGLEDVYTEEEQEQIKNRLEQLGYM
jgi:predicted AlkP superfamily phosphohydrolase/phosphomutase